MGKWTEVEGRQERDLKFNIPINNPLLKAKDTVCYERNMLLINEPDIRYIIETEARTPQAPYGDTFITRSRVCICHSGPNKCRLIMSIGITWLKSTLVKGIIRDATYKGYARYTAAFLSNVKEAIKRPVAGQSEPGIDAEVAADEGLEFFENALQEAEKESDSAIYETLKMAAELLGGILKSFIVNPIKRALWTYPLVFVLLVLCTSLWSSAILTRSIYHRLVHPELYIKSPLDSLLNRPAVRRYSALRKATLETAHFDHAYKSLEASEQDVRLLKDELLAMATSLSSVDAAIVQAKYATWLADRLSQCHLQQENCFHLEESWAELLRHFGLL